MGCLLQATIIVTKKTNETGHPMLCLIAAQPEGLPHLEVIVVGAESLFIFTSTLMAKALGK